MSHQVAQIVSAFLYVLIGCILLRSILSFFPSMQGSQLQRILQQITKPLMGPIRRFLPAMGGFDFSGLVLIILFQLMISVVQQAART